MIYLHDLLDSVNELVKSANRTLEEAERDLQQARDEDCDEDTITEFEQLVEKAQLLQASVTTVYLQRNVFTFDEYINPSKEK